MGARNLFRPLGMRQGEARPSRTIFHPYWVILQSVAQSLPLSALPGHPLVDLILTVHGIESE